MAINLAGLTKAQREKLKRNNPSLYQANVGTLGGSSKSTSLGDKNIKDITKKDLVDAFAKEGNVNAQEIQKNQYIIPKKPIADQQSEREKTIPDSDTGGSSLVAFADALNQATKLARTRRQESEMGILSEYGFEPGEVRAGTMGGILDLLEQRSGNREEVMQTAAMDAFKMEEEQKVNDMAQRQSLALELLTSGKIDQQGVAAITNAGDLNSALSVAAGVITSGNSDYADIRTIDNKLIGVKEDGTTDVLYEGDGSGSGSSPGWTSTQTHQLNAAGLGNAPYEQQVDYLFGDSTDVPNYDLANEFIEKNPDESDEKLKAGLLERRDELNLAVTDINALLAERVSEKDIKDAATEVLTDVWDKDWWRSRDTTNVGIINSELEEAKNKAKEAIYKDPYYIKQDTSNEKRILNAIDAMTYDDVKKLL